MPTTIKKATVAAVPVVPAGVNNSTTSSSTTATRRGMAKTAVPIFVVVFGVLFWSQVGMFLYGSSQSSSMVRVATSINSGEVVSSSPSFVDAVAATIVQKKNPASSQKDERAPKTARIAIVSGFVTTQNDTVVDRPRVAELMLNHLMNKACYATLWGYDFIFNTTWGFHDDLRSRDNAVNAANGNEYRYWLDYGTWHRVPHMIAALDQGYEWIIYADVDWVVQDLAVPIETLIKEWEFQGKDNVHIFVPSDANSLRVFSAFAVMIRNSDFGRAFLQNWMKFAGGMCANGNFPKRTKYNWEDTDQPGIWYALAQTHSDFYTTAEENKYHHVCNETTGLLITGRVMGPELNQYTKRVNLTKHENWNMIPDDQPIIWSNTVDGTRSGLGVQRTFGRYHSIEDRYSYAIHRKEDLPNYMMKDLEICKSRHGCRAAYDDNGQVDISCVRRQDNKTIHMVA